MNRFQQLALTQFGMQGAATGDSYVSVPSSWSEDGWNTWGSKAILSDPVGALAGGHYAFQKNFLTVVSGPAGVGKSELVKQLCRRGMSESRMRQVFPIRLSSCRFKGSSLVGLPERDIAPGELLDFLFSSLLGSGDILSTDLIARPALKEIGDEGMILALDGLDEIIGRKEQHKRFWAALWELLKTVPSGKGGVRLLVTCRTDYLRAFNLDDRSGFGDVLVSDESFPVHFLGLDFFAPSQVRDFLRKQRINDPFLIRMASQLDTESSRIVEIMQRPLLLLLLCQLRSMDGQSTGNTLPSEPTDLLDKLAQAAEDKQQGESRWSRDKLGAESLKLFKRRMKGNLVAPEFKIAEIASLLNLKEGQTLNESQLLAAIHFCPFLRHDSENAVQFTHQLFYEYFVARGMYLQVQSDDGAQEPWVDFDRYVLPTDMRRFLRGLLGDRWQERTLRSYSMQEPNGLLSWPDPVWARAEFPNLERIRYALLNFITEPHSADKAKTMEALKEFLALKPSFLFPAYRMYGFEALAVFVWTFRWSEGKEFTKPLEDNLHRFLQESAKERAAHEGDEIYVDSLERLALKAMEIGRRLKISKVMNQVRRPAMFDWIQTSDTRAEVDALVRDLTAG